MAPKTLWLFLFAAVLNTQRASAQSSEDENVISPDDMSKFFGFDEQECKDCNQPKNNSEYTFIPNKQDLLFTDTENNQIYQDTMTKLEALLTEFAVKLDQIFLVPKQYLNSIQQKNEKLNDIRRSIDDFIERSKLVVESLIDFFNVTSNNYEKTLKSLRLKMNKIIETFKMDTNNLPCVLVKNSEDAYRRCLEDLYENFTNSVAEVRNEIEPVLKTVQTLGADIVLYVQQKVETVLKDAEYQSLRISKELWELRQLDQEKKDEQFLESKSNYVLKQLYSIIDSMNLAIATLKKEIQTAVDSVLTKLDATYAIPLETAVDKYGVALACAKPPLDTTTVQDKIQAYIEGKTKTILEYLVAQNLSEAYDADRDKTELEIIANTLLRVYSAETVAEKCKKENPLNFISCVNSTYDELQVKINALEEKAQALYKTVTGKLLADNLQAFIKIENDVLKEAADDADKEIKILENLASVPVQNKAYVDATIRKYQDAIYPQVDALVNSNISSAVKSLSIVLEKIVSDFTEKLTFIVMAASKKVLSENDRTFIQQYVDIIVNKAQPYNKQASDYKDYVQMYVKIFYEYLNVDVKSNLLLSCAKDICNINAFTECASDNFKIFDMVLSQFLYDLHVHLKKIEDLQTDAEFTIANEIKRLLQIAKDAYQSTDSDENNSNDDAVLSKCLDTVNRNIGESLSNITTSVIALRNRLRLSVMKEIQQGIKKLENIRNPVIEALLIIIYFNLSDTEQYIRQKAELDAYNEKTSLDIYNFAEQNLDSFIEQTRKLFALKEEITSHQAAFVENLNSSCQTLYSSKKQYSLCIDEQCSKFNNYINESVSLLNVLFTETNTTYFNIVNKVKTNLESEIKAAEDKSRSELKNLPEYAATNTDQINPSLSGAIVSKCQNDLSKKADSLHQIIVDILSLQERLKITTDREIQDAMANIKLSLFSIREALDFIITQIRPTELESYYEQKYSVDAYEDDALIRLYDNVNKNSETFYNEIAKLVDIKQVFTLYQNNVKDLNNYCQATNSSVKLVANCVDAQCSSWRNYLVATENDLKTILSATSESFTDIIYKLRNNVELEKRKAEEKSLNDRESLFTENNVSQDSVISTALTEVENYTASLKEKLAQINKAAENLRAIENGYIGRENVFNDLPLLLNKHETNMWSICPYALFNNELNKSKALLESEKSTVLKAFPDQTNYINQQFNLTILYEATLENYLDLIEPDNIKASCADVLSDFVTLSKCAKGVVKTFNDALASFNTEWSAAAINAQVNLDQRSNDLQKWANDYVIAQYKNSSLQVKEAIEKIYNGVCNVGKTNLKKYVKRQLSDRYYTLRPSLQRVYRNVSLTADMITSRNYDDIVDIKQELNNAMDFFKVAVAAAQSKNASYVNTKLQEQADQYISNATNEFIRFLAFIKSNAVTLKEQSQLALQRASNIVTALDDAPIDKCFSNDSSSTKKTEEIDCLNNQIDYLEQKIIQECLKVMEGFAKDLQSYISRKSVVLDYVNKLQTALRTYSAQLAVKVYKDSAIDVPEYLKPYASVNGS